MYIDPDPDILTNCIENVTLQTISPSSTIHLIKLMQSFSLFAYYNYWQKKKKKTFVLKRI